MLLFLLFAIVAAVSAQKFLQLSLHDVCKDGPEVWRCKIMSNCPGLKEFMQKGQKPDICSFSGREPIVCCPSSLESLGQTSPTTQPTKRPTSRTTTRPTNQPSPTYKPFTWSTNDNRITESRPVWGTRWATKPSADKSSKPPLVTSKPTNTPETISSSTSKAAQSLHDVCKDGPEVWRCKIMSNCPGLKEFMQKGQKPDICSFSGREPIVCCPSSLESLGQTSPTTQPTKRPTSRTTTRPTNQPSPTYKPFTWSTNDNRITESRPVWGTRWATKPSADKSSKPPLVTSKPTNTPETISSSTSKAAQKCKEYGKFVYRVEVSPILIGNSEPETIVTNECNIQTLIVGGIDARPREFPHMALVGYRERPPGDWFCGGSLISPKFVLSAAHCSKPGGRVAKWARLGDLDTSIENDDARPVERRIIKIYDHPDYNDEVIYNDIALYELQSAVKLNAYIRPICLFTEKEIPSRDAIASGWGHTSWGGLGSSMLQKVNLSIINNENCNKEFGKGEYRKQLPNKIQDSLMLCAGGEPRKDTCQGDSGGPLQIEHKSVYCMYSQIGVVSYGKGCALSYPGVYTRISNYIPWIENIVWP